jgi:hypothetical protein
MRRVVLPLLLGVTLTMSVAEFLDVHKLPPEVLRERYRLPPSCEPRVSAVRGRLGDVTVIIDCQEEVVPASARYAPPSPRS